MKKVCSLFLAVLSLVIITGCGSSAKNEITCTQKEDDDKVSVTVRTDKDDKIVSVKMSVEMKAPSKSELDSTYEIMKASSKEKNKVDGVKYNVSKKDLNLIIDTEVDFNKVSDEIKSELNIENFETTGAEFKKNAEADGAICK